MKKYMRSQTKCASRKESFPEKYSPPAWGAFARQAREKRREYSKHWTKGRCAYAHAQAFNS